MMPARSSPSLCRIQQAVIDRIARDRLYVKKPKGTIPRAGPDAGRLRLRLISTTPPPELNIPEQCKPVEFVEATYHSITVLLKEVPFDGNDEPHRYEMEVAWVDPIEPEKYASSFRLVYQGIDPDPVYHANQALRRRLLARMGKAHLEADDASATSATDGTWNGYKCCVSQDRHNLVPDMEYVFRLRAVNTIGPGPWSEERRYDTLPKPEPVPVPYLSVPKKWLSISVRDLCRAAAGRPGGPAKDRAWSALAPMLLAHMDALKIVFRVHALLGCDQSVLTGDAPPSTINVHQFRRFLLDANYADVSQDHASTLFMRSCQPDEDDSSSSDEEDEPVHVQRFRRYPPVNAAKATELSEVANVPASASAGSDDGRSSPTIPTSGPSSPTAYVPPTLRRQATQKQLVKDSKKILDPKKLLMQQHDFVHALVRMAWHLYKDSVPNAQALAGCFQMLVVQVIEPMASRITNAITETSTLRKSRAVRAAFSRHYKELLSTFLLYARTDKLADGGHAATLCLSELFALLGDTGLMEKPNDKRPAFSARAVAEAFVFVNIEDELYVPDNLDDLSTELVFDEFTMLLLRLFQQTSTAGALTVSFGVALEAWLAHEVVPRARIARQKRLLTGQGS